MELRDVIYSRYSVRKFKDEPVPEEAILEMVRAAGAAPSGKNAQNWRFLVIRRRDLMEKVAETLLKKNEEIAGAMEAQDKEKADRFRKFAKHFSLFFLGAPVLVAVYTTDYLPSGYSELGLIGDPDDRMDDIWLRRNPGMQSLGAAIENFILSSIDQGFGACWLTSLNYAAKELEILLEQEAGFRPEGWFLGAFIALGVPDGPGKSPQKKALEEICTFVD